MCIHSFSFCVACTDEKEYTKQFFFFFSPFLFYNGGMFSSARNNPTQSSEVNLAERAFLTAIFNSHLVPTFPPLSLFPLEKKDITKSRRPARCLGQLSRKPKAPVTKTGSATRRRAGVRCLCSFQTPLSLLFTFVQLFPKHKKFLSTCLF